MKNNSKTFFTEQEKQAIESAIKDAESKTSGEIVTMIVDRSDGYRDIEVFAGMIFSALIAVYPAQMAYMNSGIILRKLLPSMNWLSQIPDGTRFITGLLSFIAVTLILYIPVKFLFFKFPVLKRLFLSEKRIDAEVRDRAIRAFHEHSLGNTRDATGVLFLISLLEKRVYVLADHGIYTKVTQETLDSYAASIGKGIAAGGGSKALCEAITNAGKELEKYFPRRADDTNELPDRMVFEK